MPKLTNGVSCPFCGSGATRVSKTEHQEFVCNDRRILGTYRRRLCTQCGLYFGTMELPHDEPPLTDYRPIDR